MIVFNLDDSGNLTFTHEREAIYLGNINEGLKPPSEIRRFDVKRLALMGVIDINYKDTRPSEYKNDAREKVIKLDGDLNERSKAIKSSSGTDAKAIELIEITPKDINTTLKNVEQGTPFIEAGERGNLLPLR